MTLAEQARQLNLRRLKRGRRRLPALILMTDEARLADPIPSVRRLPRGSAVILRHYDHPTRAVLAQRLAGVCRRRGLLLLIGGDTRLAASVGAAGLHLPEGLARRARPRLHPGWLITVAAHSPAALRRAAAAGADAVLLSPVFPTASHPGAHGLGPLRFTRWCRESPLPVYALGGIDTLSIRQLQGSGAAGISGISALT